MRLSARNQLPGTVVAIDKGAVNGIVKIEVAPGLVITSTITNAAIDALGLTEGAAATARCHQGFLRHGGRDGLTAPPCRPRAWPRRDGTVRPAAAGGS